MKTYRYGQTSGFSFGQSLEATTNRMLYFALLLHLPHFSKKDFLEGHIYQHLIGEENHVRHLWLLAAPSTLFYSYLSDRKKRVNDICTTAQGEI